MLQKRLLIALLIFTIAGGGYARITNAASDNVERGQTITTATYGDQNGNNDEDPTDINVDDPNDFIDDDEGGVNEDGHQGNHDDGHSVTDETYGDQTSNNEDDQEINQIDAETVNNLIANLTQLIGTPAKDAIENLLKKDISLDDLISLFSDLLDKNTDQKQQVISNEQLVAYVEAIHTKINNSIELQKQYGHYLKELAELYDKIGDIENSIDVSEEAIHTDVTK